MRFRLAAVALVLAILFTSGGIAIAANPYPLPTPDFSHPDAPHQFNAESIPLTWQIGFHHLLVIYGTFTDATDPNLTESQIEALFFPEDTFGTVVNYFKVVSGGEFEFVPAPERGGEVDNGVVVINLGASAPFQAMTPQQRRRTLLDRADAVVDFDQFDENDDGQLTGDELAVVTMYTSSSYTCGQTTGVAAGNQLDGKTVAFATVEGGTGMNMMTYAHELGHQHMGMTDFYGYGVGQYDITGPTCGAGGFQFPSSWSRLHWLWDPPITVTQDGYYDVSRVAPGNNNPILGASYLLYDPDHGTQEYFLIENRQASGYDQNIADNGLIIWRIDERNLDSPVEAVRPIEMIRPDGTRNPGCLDQDLDGVNELTSPACYGGNSADAWDPSDFSTPQRSMVGKWGDGTNAKLAVRAIAASSNHMWVYLDVRGPGVMVDPADAQGRRFQIEATAGQATQVSFPVMNTGETTDTFQFTVTGPTGWIATTQTMTLAAGQQTTATISVTPPVSAAGGIVGVVARGQSTTSSNVLTTAQFDMTVKRPISLQYTGDVTADYSDPATVSAHVTDGLSGTPLANRIVKFDLGSQTANATTDVNGNASTSIVLAQQPGTVNLSAHVAGDAVYSQGDAAQSFVIDKEDYSFALTSPNIVDVNGSTSLSIQATQENDGSPGDLTLSDVQVVLTPTLTQTTYMQRVMLDATGAATVTFAGLPSDLWSVTITPISDYWEGPTLFTELVVVDPDVTIGGYLSGTDAATNKVSLTATVSYSGSTPVGAVDLKSKPNKFKTTQVHWVVTSGTRVLVEAEGTYNDVPAVIRAEIRDSGLKGGKQDSFATRVMSPDGTVMYQSGDVLRESGDIVIARP